MDQFLVDSHCHLDDSDFDADRASVIERARAVGLRYLMAIGGGRGPDELAVSLPFAEAYDWIYAAVGIHPHESKRAEERHYDALRTAALTPRVLAVGEIGLDYHYDHSPRETQRRVFIRQLEIGREVKRPVVVHCREAWADLRELVREHWQSAGLGGILHCFTGSREDAAAFLDWGFLVSFAGNVTYRSAQNLRDVARDLPLDRLLTETDSPYLTPVPYRGKRNEPAHVVEVTRQLACLHHMAEKELGEQVVQNFARFFHLI